MNLPILPHPDPLFARADRAIADAIATRLQVRAKRAVAQQTTPRSVDHVTPASPLLLPFLDLPPMPMLEPWLSVARALAETGQIIREADAELDRAFNRIAPLIETPPDLSRD